MQSSPIGSITNLNRITNDLGRSLNPFRIILVQCVSRPIELNYATLPATQTNLAARAARRGHRERGRGLVGGDGKE